MNRAELTGRKSPVLKLGQWRDTVSSVGNAQLGKLEEWIAKNSSWLAIGVIAAAFAVRLVYSASCYLNPDEALHFNAARPSNWLEAYESSHALAHPPLFILVLHAILFLGRTELILRLPSIVGGTVALWLTFAWIRRILGGIPALVGLLFMAVSPAAISASTEVRQYGMLLCFICGSLYATERALTERSTRWAIIQGLFLLGALLTNYTAPVVIISLDLYVLLRCLLDGIPSRILFTIGAAQLVLAAVLGWLYFDHVRQSTVFSPASLFYLRQSYYVSASETLLRFSWRALFGTFAYMVSRKWAILSMVACLTGFAALLSGRTKAGRLSALLIVFPFAMGLATAIYQVFPFVGSRHQTYLLPFLAASFSAAFTWIPRSLAAPLLLLGVAFAPYWAARNPPDNNPRLMPIGEMKAAIEYIDQTIPHDAPLFMDRESRLVLTYYLGRNDLSQDTSLAHLLGNEERLGGHRILASGGSVWSFSPDEVLAQVNESAASFGVSTRAPVWIISVAWPQSESLASQLAVQGQRNAKEFGAISVIRTMRN